MKKSELKIAIVDDHVDSVTSLSNYLEGRGIKTIWGYTEEKAIEICDKENPSLLIINIEIDGEKTGFNIAKEYPSINILFISGSEILRTKASKISNAVGIISKPIDQEEVYNFIVSKFGAN